MRFIRFGTSSKGSYVLGVFLWLAHAMLPQTAYPVQSTQATPRQNQPILSELEENVISQYKAVMGECADFIWPNTNWGRLSLLFVDPDRNNQNLLDLNDFSIKSVNNKQIDTATLNAYFNFLELNNKKVLSLNLKLMGKGKADISFLQESLFTLGTHEGFHYIGQDNWNLPTNNQRGTEVPILYQPRYYRYMILKNLKSYFINNSAAESISKALYWYLKWKTEFPREFNSNMDLIEGTTRYVDQMALAVSKRGCSSEAEVFSELENIVSESPKYDVEAISQGFALDMEAYPLGSLSVFILKKESQDAELFTKLQKGTHPMDLLLEMYKPLNESDDGVVLEKFRTLAGEANKKVNLHLGDIYSRIKDKNTLFVNVPVDWMQGSFSPLGFYTDYGLGYHFIPLANSLEFRSSDKKSKLNVGAKSVFFTSNTDACSNMGWQITLNSSSYKLQESSLSLNSSNLSGQLKGKLRNLSDGRFIFCAGE